MKLYAISDLHISNQQNRDALDAMPYYPDDWLIIAGDLGETFAHYHYSLARLTRRFARIIWVPGNHDLWTLSSPLYKEDTARGEEKYRKLVDVCRSYNVLTPEDPYVVWPGEGPAALLVPLFLLYDYSFRPADVPLEQALAWAEAADVLCTDEALLHPDPYPSRIAWCQARCDATELRLQREIQGRPVIFINHFPLLQELVRLPSIPRFSLWCGTRRTQDWHTRFPTLGVVYGHLHMRATDYLDGVRFEEVSLGYAQQWQPGRGIEAYFREILPGSSEKPPFAAGPFWH